MKHCERSEYDHRSLEEGIVRCIRILGVLALQSRGTARLTADTIDKMHQELFYLLETLNDEKEVN